MCANFHHTWAGIWIYIKDLQDRKEKSIFKRDMERYYVWGEGQNTRVYTMACCLGALRSDTLPFHTALEGC